MVKGVRACAEDIYTMIPRCNKRGFTLIEAMLAVVVLAVAAAGVLLPFASGATIQADGIHKTLAGKLAGDLLEKIASRPFGEIIPNWNGYTEARGQVKDSAGSTYTDPVYAKFSRRATCELMQWPGSSLPKVFILVTVRVSYGDSELVCLTRLVSQ
jgi:prepilin-type N-terminal cleavage/methylation domain-containing protein